MRDCWLGGFTSLIWLLAAVGVQGESLTSKGVPAGIIEGAYPRLREDENRKYVNYPYLAQTCQHEQGGMKGTLLLWGLHFYTQTPEDCCAACKMKDGCNRWSYCAGSEGCGGLFKPRECWLMHKNVEDKDFSYLFVDARSPGFVGGYSMREKVPLAIDLYYANGEFQSSVDSGYQVKNLVGFYPGGEFKFVSIGDCAHLCELFQSRGCDSFHFTRAIHNDIDSCILASGASKETVSTNTTHVTTFFRDKSIQRPKGITSIEDYWTHTADGRAYRSVGEDDSIMPVVFPSGFRSSYDALTVEECSDICSITNGCVSFDYRDTGRGTCVLKDKANLNVRKDDSGWQTYWNKGVKGPVIDVVDIDSSKQDVPSTLWIVIGIGLCTVCLLLVSLVSFLCKKRTTVIIVQGGDKCKLVGASSPPLSEVDLNLDFKSLDLDKENPIGAGSFGVVYKGMYQNKHVAVKLLAPEFQAGAYLRSFQEEMKILCRVRHDNIVLCHGGSIRPPDICIVEELMEMSLGAFLYPLHKQSNRMSIRDILKLTVELSAALAHIHPIIIHRDLKPGNILLDKKNRAKIADFGLSRIKASTYLSTECATRGTVAYMAPECFCQDANKITEKVDIYALACILWECLSGEPPWRKLPNHFAIINHVAFLGVRPEIPSGTPGKVMDIITDCWAQSPKDRPSAQEVLQRSTDLLGDKVHWCDNS